MSTVRTAETCAEHCVHCFDSWIAAKARTSTRDYDFAQTWDGLAELLRHEEITDPEDLPGITRSLWAVDVPDPVLAGAHHAAHRT